jgi:hypothetical protein
MNSKVQVGICLRPLAKSEVDAGAESVIKIVGSKRVVATNDARYSFSTAYMIQIVSHWRYIFSVLSDFLQAATLLNIKSNDF